MDLQKLNSLTKYPSIPTYHEMGERGKLLEKTVSFSGRVIGTEKIDGVNSRIILLPDNKYIIGSREEFLYHCGDILHNPAHQIVETIRPLAEGTWSECPRDSVKVLYFEVYGGSNITASSKNYTSKKETAYRLFDVAFIPNLSDHLSKPIENIALWRDNGGQKFYGEESLITFSLELGFPLTPRLFDIPWDELSHTVGAVRSFLFEHLPWTHAALDENVSKIPEGIVLRTPDRSVIAKMKFRDYK